MRKKVLITGATGFIGKFLVEEALSLGYEVFVAVRSTSKIDGFLNKNITIVKLDFENVESLHDKIYTLPRFDYVIHNAGLTKSFRSEDYFEVNYGYTRRLANALKQQNKVPDKFFFMSSLAAFGPGPKGTNKPVANDSEPHPVTFYGQSKLVAEKFIIEKSGLPYIVFRPTAVYGPGEKDLFKAISLLNNRIDLQIGKQKQCLTFIYVKDLARMVFKALESNVVNQAFFVNDGNVYTNYDMGKIMSRLTGKKVFTFHVPLSLARVVASVSEKAGKMKNKPTILNKDKMNELSAGNWNCDAEPLKSKLSFVPQYDLKAGLAETLNWYKQHGWLK